MNKPSHVTSYPGQLSLAIPPRTSAMSISESWERKQTHRDALAPYRWSWSLIMQY